MSMHLSIAIDNTDYPLTDTEDRVIISGASDEWHRHNDVPGSIVASIVQPYGPYDKPPAGYTHPTEFAGRILKIITLSSNNELKYGIINQGIINSVSTRRLVDSNDGTPRWLYSIYADDAFGTLSRIKISISRPRELWLSRLDAIIAQVPAPYKYWIPESKDTSIHEWLMPVINAPDYERMRLAAIDYKNTNLIDILSRTFIGYNRYIRRSPGGEIYPGSDGVSVDYIRTYPNHRLSWLGTAPWLIVADQHIERIDSATLSATSKVDKTSIKYFKTYQQGAVYPDPFEYVFRRPDGAIEMSSFSVEGDFEDYQNTFDFTSTPTFYCRLLERRIRRYMESSKANWKSRIRIVTNASDTPYYKLLSAPTRYTMDLGYNNLCMITSYNITITKSRQEIEADVIPAAAAGVVALSWDDMKWPRGNAGLITFDQANSSNNQWPLELWRSAYCEGIV